MVPRILLPLSVTISLSSCLLILPPGGSGGSGGADTDAPTSTAPSCDCNLDCIDNGFECDDPVACVCGAPLSEPCFNGALAFCACSDPPCPEDEELAMYMLCWQSTGPEQDAIICYGVYAPDCAAAAAACLS